jgi:hypothetical protein
MTIPAAAIHCGPPTRETIRVIGLLTTTDDRGRRHYRTSAAEGWRHLVTPRDYDRLNDSIAAITSTGKE